MTATKSTKIMKDGSGNIFSGAVAAEGIAGDTSALAYLASPSTEGIVEPATNGTGYGASNVTAVTGTFVATGQSASFTPLAGRSFNVTSRGTFVASFQLERSFDSGSNWHPLTISGILLYVWTVPVSEVAQEDQFGVIYRLNCTAYTSGTVTYRISQ